MGMKPSSFIYWIRVGTAIIAAVLCALLSLGESTGIFLALAVYVGTSVILEYVFHLGGGESKGPFGSTVWTSGVGTYYILWVMVWTLLNTILT
ncbi:MAG: Rab5-interacting family protein [Candidatus Bathyarchaeota archaeon]|nr:MAG: Rab5-interacting family protein [Candidatus Bathyarchaeota archaeon]